MTRYLQHILMIIGFTSLGILCGGLGAASLSVVTIFRSAPGTSAESNQGAYVGVMLVMLLGAVCGAVVGFATAVRIMACHEFRHWHLLTWLGVLPGIYLSGAILLSDELDSYGILAELFHTWPGTVLLITSLAAAGGMGGSFAAAVLVRSSRKLPLLVLALNLTSDRF